MQFREFYFEFDGKKSKDKNLKMVIVDGKDEESMFGVEQEIIEEENGTDTPLFLGVKRKPKSLKITIMKMNKDSNSPLPYSDKELDEICRWLFKKEYKPLKTWDNTGKTYYVIFTKGSDFFNCAKEGYINLEMRLNAGYGYSNLFDNDYWINGEKVIDIYNGSDIDNFIYPDIEFELRGSSNLEISNLSLNETMTFNHLVPNDHIMIYNEGLKDMVSLVDKSRNIFKCSNKKFIRLQYGLNRIKVKGNCRIRFLYQYPLGFK